MMRAIVVALMVSAVTAGCGGGSNEDTSTNCSPTTVNGCVATDAAGMGCVALTDPADGKPVYRVTCSGNDARLNCYPMSHSICVDSCSNGGLLPCK